MRKGRVEPIESSRSCGLRQGIRLEFFIHFWCSWSRISCPLVLWFGAPVVVPRRSFSTPYAPFLSLQSHPRSRGERVTHERRDQKGTEVNEERLNRESGCDGRGRECRVSLLTAFASFTSRTARREGNRMMNVERESRQAKEGSKVGCISQPFTAPCFRTGATRDRSGGCETRL